MGLLRNLLWALTIVLLWLAVVAGGTGNHELAGELFFWVLALVYGLVYVDVDPDRWTRRRRARAPRG